jgi:hypothetical protein
MKKLLFTLIVVGAGYAIWRKVSEDNAERDLWSEVTDSFE